MIRKFLMVASLALVAVTASATFKPADAHWYGYGYGWHHYWHPYNYYYGGGYYYPTCWNTYYGYVCR